MISFNLFLIQVHIVLFILQDILLDLDVIDIRDWEIDCKN